MEKTSNAMMCPICQGYYRTSGLYHHLDHCTRRKQAYDEAKQIRSERDPDSNAVSIDWGVALAMRDCFTNRGLRIPLTEIAIIAVSGNYLGWLDACELYEIEQARQLGNPIPRRRKDPPMKKA